jgi:hypothetical protein
MAKKTTKKVARKRAKIVPADDSEQVLADLVAASDMLLVRLNTIAAQRDDDPPADLAARNSVMDVTLSHRYEPRENGSARLHYDLYINSIATPKDKGPVITLICSFIAVYTLAQNTPQPSQNLVEAFGQRVALFAIWPYWRELAQSISLRLHVPPLPIPFLTPEVAAQFKRRQGPPDLGK